MIIRVKINKTIIFYSINEIMMKQLFFNQFFHQGNYRLERMIFKK
jgi:hypothetical protein